jgi:hypothetical protein
VADLLGDTGKFVFYEHDRAHTILCRTSLSRGTKGKAGECLGESRHRERLMQLVSSMAEGSRRVAMG